MDIKQIDYKYEPSISMNQAIGIVGNDNDLLSFEPFLNYSEIETFGPNLLNQATQSFYHQLENSIDKFQKYQPAEWIMLVSSYVTMYTLHIIFTKSIDDCFRLLKTNPKAFHLYANKLQSAIQDLLTAFHSPISSQEFSKTSLALLLINSHLHKVKQIEEQKIHFSIEQYWQYSLKFRLIDSQLIIETGDISISHHGEYWGESKPIVFTPQTENILCSLIRHTSNFQFPLLYSPEGTGKASIFEFLASSIGSYFLKFYPFPNSTFQELTQILAGIACSDSVLLIQNIDHMPQHLLSFLTDNILSFRNSLQQGLSS
jgi:hypothetical protein